MFAKENKNLHWLKYKKSNISKLFNACKDILNNSNRGFSILTTECLKQFPSLGSCGNLSTTIYYSLMVLFLFGCTREDSDL